MTSYIKYQIIRSNKKLHNFKFVMFIICNVSCTKGMHSIFTYYMVVTNFDMKHGKIQCHRTSNCKCETFHWIDKTLDDMAIFLHKMLNKMVDKGICLVALDVPVYTRRPGLH